MRTSIKWHIEYADAPGVMVGDHKFFNINQGGTCEQDRQALAALSLDDKKTHSDATLPNSPVGFVLRQCGTQPQDDILIPYLAEGDSFHPDETVTVTPTTTDPSDRSGETNQRIYSSNITL